MTTEGSQVGLGSIHRSTEKEEASETGHGNQEALRKQLASLTATLASIGDGVISTDSGGRVSFINSVAERLTGWRRVEALGRPLGEVLRLLNEIGRRAVEIDPVRGLRQGVNLAFENHVLLIARDGSERPIECSVGPLNDADGDSSGTVLVFRDVSARRQADEVQARLAAIVESSEDAIISKNLDGIIRTWNTGSERLFGYSQEEAIGRPINLIIPPDRQTEEQAILARIRQGERVGTFETVRVAKDGRLLDISLTVSPIRDERGRIIGASKVARDITDRKTVAEGLARVTAESDRLKRLYETILSTTPDLVYIFGLDHKVLYANQALLSMWGSSQDQVIGKTLLEIGYEPWHAEMHSREIEQVRETKQSIRGEVPFTGTNGRRIYEYIFAPVIGSDGQVEAVAGTTRDVTERKESEESLRQADRRKDEFLALLAHELRNPLAPLRNGLHVMRLAESDKQIITQTRAMMERQLGHMIRLIDDLLDISRISQNKMELRISQLLLTDIVSNAVEAARPVIEAAGHDFHIDIPTEPIYLDADLTRVAQVLSNLLTNSAKYSEKGSKIWLKAELIAREVIFSVKDNGIGIPPTELPRIFDMFSQVDRSLDRSTGGLGIGLALVKGLVEMHGGTVTAASDGYGCGSLFTVRLPTLATNRSKIKHSLPIEAPTGTRIQRRILVVDDNRDSALSMSKMLALSGHTVSTAFDGLQAVETAPTFQPDVILMDVGMPVLNGYEATHRIRKEEWGRQITIIALTGWGQSSDRMKSQQAGCDAHLVKPVNFGELEQLMTELRSRIGT